MYLPHEVHWLTLHSQSFLDTSTSYGNEVQASTLGWSPQAVMEPLQAWDYQLIQYYTRAYLTAELSEPNPSILAWHSPATGYSSPVSVSPDLSGFRDLSIDDRPPASPGDGTPPSPQMDRENQGQVHNPDLSIPGGPRHGSSSSSSLGIGLATFDIPLPDVQDAPVLSPIVFASQGDDSPLDCDPLVLFNDQTYSPAPSHPTLEVGSMLYNIESPRSLFRSDSGRSYSTSKTSSSEGVTGSDFSPSFYHSSLANRHFMNNSSSSSLMIPSDSEVPGADSSGGKLNSLRQMTMPLPVHPYAPPTDHIYLQLPYAPESNRRHSFPPAKQYTSKQVIEPPSFFPPDIQVPHDPDESSRGTSSQALASRAILEAAGRRRTKVARYGCSFCPQKLTSRDNLISKLIMTCARGPADA